MLQKDPWLLPDGIDEVLPDDAAHLERLRRQLLDVFNSWGYQLVIPPLVDYLASLLTGTGHELDLQTFKFTDSLSGEMLGVRADMTPQVARIDAHNLRHESPTRLCYVGTVLHTVSDKLEQSRSPMQIGAEIYGHQGRESDLEVIQLMVEMLTSIGLEDIHLDLGHVGIYRALSKQAGLNSQQEGALFDILQRKATTELIDVLKTYTIDNEYKKLFLKLPKLNGNRDVLTDAAAIFSDSSAEIKQALADLQKLADQLHIIFPSLSVNVDLAELRGYHYHTGIIFAALTPNIGREIARGGRYDNIGGVFGRARPATGFSADLKFLASLAKENRRTKEIIFAPYVINDPQLTERVKNLRVDGCVVIQQLPEQSGGAKELKCTAILTKENKNWLIKPFV
ncbi:MAG: ATP phosphoribosyltransferase regulatory subunit [Methylococcales bacterium]|nr:ATP phosphoribosyltransferase regulatory subunit [Methylococcales bacterium]